MFKRRRPRSHLQNLRELFWPSMGWRRATRYTVHRLVRLADTTSNIASGLAIGAAISFTPILGTHFIQAGLIAYFLRANLLAALIGTFFGNPWTFPFIWWGALSTGTHLLSALNIHISADVPADLDYKVLWHVMMSKPMHVFLPMLIGGYLLAFLSYFPFYGGFYLFIRYAKAARTRAKIRLKRKASAEITGNPVPPPS